jgi:hypothetical protein
MEKHQTYQDNASFFSLKQYSSYVVELLALMQYIMLCMPPTTVTRISYIDLLYKSTVFICCIHVKALLLLY